MRKHAIATLTMNPALDVTTSAQKVIPTHKVRCATPRTDPGGGGVNVARVAQRLGADVTAVYPAGGPTGELFHKLLDAQGVQQHIVNISGNTRENFAVSEAESGEQYRFVLPGPDLSDQDQQQCLDALEKLKVKPEYLVASGSLAPGVSPDFYARVARLARKMDARLILDTSGEPLRQAGEEGAYLIKPSLRELSELAGRALDTQEAQIEYGRELLQQDHAEAMVLSLGSEGALLITRNEAEHFAALQVPVKSATGAGDSMVGGITVALARGEPLRHAVRFGMAAGAAALMSEGTELCSREDVESLYQSLHSG